MKTYCKHTRCGGTLFVRHCIDLYLKDKKGRSDVKRFIASYDGDLDTIAADMAGFTFRPDGRVNIRTVIFLRMRRAFNRAARASWIGYALAKRCASYWGYLVHSDSWSYRRRHGIDSTMSRVRASLRLHAKMQRRRYAITDRVQ